MATSSPSNSLFTQRKRKILQDLSRPSSEYDDLSPKGSVDEQVRELVDEINQTEGYVTTSSCAGRVAVFLEGGAKPKAIEEDDQDEGASSSQGKGGGKWLYVSHDPVELDQVKEEGALLELLGLPLDKPISYPFPEENVRYIHFKFEPMILHILTSSLPLATTCHTAAMSAGFRESGISSISSITPTPMVAVRTQGLALESIIGYAAADNEVYSMVSDAYLRNLVGIANQRFAVNVKRKERFRKALLEKESRHEGGNWEPADVRKARKRAEGLQRKAEMERQKATAASKVNGAEHGQEGDLFS